MKVQIEKTRIAIMRKFSGTIRIKLIIPVLFTVTAMSFFILFIFIRYYQISYESRETSSQLAQMEQALTAISMTQSAVENISKQIVVSAELQNEILDSEKSKSNGSMLKHSLRSYMYVFEYIQEIMIYTIEEETYSSMRSRDEFHPEEEAWYYSFWYENKKKGYTDVHISYPVQNGSTQKVISYVMTYYSIENYPQKLGNLVISVDQAYIENLAALDISFLKGYAIFNENGNEVISNGTIELSYAELEKIESESYKDEKGNIYLILKDSTSSWMMVSEISKEIMQKKIRMVLGILVLGFVLLIILIAIILEKNINRVVQPINQLSEAAKQFGSGNSEVNVDVHTGDEVEILADVFNKMVRDVQRYTATSLQYEKSLRKSQIDQLLLQINPHFIYNTLNSIVYMAKQEGNLEIVEFTNSFISLLQNTLHIEKAIFITLEEELKNVENYIVIQRYRYRDKFDTKIECPNNLKKFMVPKVILQPIVENSIFHGIAPMEGHGQLYISVLDDVSGIKIVIEDNGVGIRDEIKNELFKNNIESSSGMRKIGIANVQNRIKEIYGEEYGFIIESQINVGTRIIINLPMKDTL